MGQRRLLPVSVLAMACAATTPKPAPRNVEVAAPEAEEAAPPGPVPAPPRLVLVGRIKDPRAWLKLERTPPLLLDLLGESLGSAELVQAIDLEQPMEFAVGWDPAPPSAASTTEQTCEGEVCSPPPSDPSPEYWGGFSLGLKAWDPAALERLGFGVSRGSLLRENCAAARALGGAPARLVCSETREQLQKLEAYMARGLPLEELAPTPVHFEFRPQSLRPEWEKAFGELSQTLDGAGSEQTYSPLQILPLEAELQTALLDIARAGLREANAWVRAVDTIALDATATANDGLELALTVTTDDPQPWLMAAYGRAAEAANGPPAAFALLPGNARSAGYSWGLLPEDTAPLLEAARNLWRVSLAGLAAYAPSLDRRTVELVDSQIVAALDSPCLSSAQTVWASVPGPSRDGAGSPSADRVLQSWLGHTLVGTSPEARCAELVKKSLKRLVTSRDVQRALREIDPKLRLRQVRAPASLGAGTEVFELSLPQSLIEPALSEMLDEPIFRVKSSERKVPAKARAPIALTLAVTSTPSADFIGVSAAPAELFALMRGLKPGSPRPELERLSSPHVVAADFYTLEGLSEELDESTELHAFLQEVAGAQALRAPIIATSGVTREGRQLKARYGMYVAAPAVATLRRLLVLDKQRFDTLMNKLTPSADPPPE